jgi:hypothetical protein
MSFKSGCDNAAFFFNSKYNMPENCLYLKDFFCKFEKAISLNRHIKIQILIQVQFLDKSEPKFLTK